MDIVKNGFNAIKHFTDFLKVNNLPLMIYTAQQSVVH